jgi:hypothetical protein
MPWIVKQPRCSILLLSGLGVALVAARCLWYANTHPDLRTKVSHIRQGMTTEQVHENIGCPPGTYGSKAGLSGKTQCYQGPRYEEWLFDDGDVMVTYFSFQPDSGKCMYVLYRESHSAKWQPVGTGLIDRLTAALGF